MRAFLLLSVSLLCAIGIGVGAIATAASGPSAKAALQQAQRATRAAGSAELGLVIQVAGPAKNTIVEKGSGAIDFRSDSLELSLTSPSESGLALRVVLVGHVLYLNSPALGTLFVGKDWVALGLRNGLGGASRLLIPPPSIRQAIRSGTTVTKSPTTGRNGSPETAYRLSVSKKALLEAISQGLDLSSSARAKLGHSLRGATWSLVEDVASSGRLAGLHASVEPARAGVSLSLSLTFSHFGVPVSATAPPAKVTVPFRAFEKRLATLAAPKS